MGRGLISPPHSGYITTKEKSPQKENIFPRFARCDTGRMKRFLLSPTSNMPKQNKLTTEHSTDTVSLENLVVLYEKFAVSLNTLTAEVTALRKEVAELREQRATSAALPKWYQSITDSNPLLKAIFTDEPELRNSAYSAYMIRQATKAQEKNYIAVIEKLIHQDNSKDLKQLDAEFVNRICEQAQIVRPTDTWRIQIKNTNRTPPLKVRFPTTKDRDAFIFNFNRSLPPNLPSPRPTTRRDLTVPELQFTYSLREKARIANEDCNLFRYVVRDMDIVELKNPQPLKKQRT
jgi:hypothetical protein